MNRLRAMQVLNDNTRTEFLGVMWFSREFYDMPQSFKREALQRIRSYKKFGTGSHHDAGLILMKPAVHWRIEYRTPDMKGKSRAPLDPTQTLRVLIVELAEQTA